MSMEIYREEAKKRLAELDVSDELREVLTGYLLVVATMNYKAISSLRDRVLPDITLLIDFLAKKKGATLELSDLDLTKLKSHAIMEYLIKRTDSPDTRYVINSFIGVFGRWLEREGYINKFAFVKMQKPRLPFRRRLETAIGRGRKLAELDKIFASVDIPTPRVIRDRLPQYRYWAHLLLESGLRPEHLLKFRVGDLYSDEVAIDVFGNTYRMIRAFEAVAREKKAIGEEISKKLLEEYVYIYEPLQREILDYCTVKKGWDNEDPLIPIPLRSLETRMTTIGGITGITDFVWYDMRKTWASVIYNATAPRGPLALMELGGWASSKVAVASYVEAMKPPEAVEIAKKYHIFIPEIYKFEVDSILKGKKTEVSPEEMEAMTKTIINLKATMEKMGKKIEDLEKGK